MPPAAPTDDAVEQLLATHRPQLEASPIPQRHWEALLSKLARSRLDAGSTFALTYADEAEERLKAVVVKEGGVQVCTCVAKGLPR